MAGNYRVKVLEAGRIATRGLHRSGAGVGMTLDSDETIQIVIDWTAWLGADTIASVTNSATGATVSGASNTTTTATLSIRANDSAIIEHRVTTATGQTKELPIYINGTEGFRGGRRCYE